MKLSTKGRYAARALLDMALNPGDGPTSLKEIALRLGVSAKYLDQILAQLRNAGIVRATRGSKGGFTLSAEPSELRLLDIVNVMEGKTSLVDCVADEGLCDQSADCVTRDVWAEVSEAIDGVLGSVTLADLAERVKVRETTAS